MTFYRSQIFEGDPRLCSSDCDNFSLKSIKAVHSYGYVYKIKSQNVHWYSYS